MRLLLELQVSDKLVCFEEVGGDHRFAAEGQVLEGQIANVGILLSPQELGFTDDAGSGDGDVLEEDAGEVAGAALVLALGFRHGHADEELLQRGAWVGDADVAKDHGGTCRAFAFAAHVEDASAAPVMPFGAGIDHVAVFDDELVVRECAEDEGGAIRIIPQHHSADAEAVCIERVILRADEAVFDAGVSKWIDAIAIGAPSEDLGPSDFVGMTFLEAVDQHDGVRRGIGDGKSFYLRVAGSKNFDGLTAGLGTASEELPQRARVLQSRSGKRAVTKEADVMTVGPFGVVK